MKKLLSWGIPALLLVGLVVWRFTVNAAAQAQTSGAQRNRQRAAASVEVATAEPRTLSNSLQTVGSAQSPFKVEIAPKTTGRINFLQVREGDSVKAGDVVLRIDPSDLQGAVVQAQANVADAQSKLAQAKITQHANSVSVNSQVSQQQAAVRSARADLDQVTKNYQANKQQAQAQVDAAQAGVRNAEAALDKEKANLRNAQVKYERTNNLYKQGFTAAQDVDDARTAVEVEQGAVGVQQALVNSAESQLNSQKQNLTIVTRKGTSDIADSQAKVDQSVATLATARANLAQTPAYQEQLQALQAEVGAAQAGLTQAQARLSDTVITSSISGTVTARKADPGALASPGTPVLEVQFLDWLYVAASLPSEVEAQLHVGQQAQMTFDALPGRTFTGPVTNVNPAADPQSRAISLMIRIDNKDHALTPGMYGQITISTGTVHAKVTVPREAVTTNPDKTQTVTVVDQDNVAHVKPVKLGAGDDKGFEVLAGVNAGEKVVVLSYTPVKDGGKVTVGKPGGNGQGAGQGQRSGQAPAGGRRRRQQQ